MSETAQQPLPTLFALTDADPATLPDANEMSAEFDAELERRRAEYESGANPGVLASDFFRELRAARDPRMRRTP